MRSQKPARRQQRLQPLWSNIARARHRRTEHCKRAVDELACHERCLGRCRVEDEWLDSAFECTRAHDLSLDAEAIECGLDERQYGCDAVDLDVSSGNDDDRIGGGRNEIRAFRYAALADGSDDELPALAEHLE